jgi:hypothetical protein
MFKRKQVFSLRYVYILQTPPLFDLHAAVSPHLLYIFIPIWSNLEPTQNELFSYEDYWGIRKLEGGYGLWSGSSLYAIYPIHIVWWYFALTFSLHTASPQWRRHLEQKLLHHWKPVSTKWLYTKVVAHEMSAHNKCTNFYSAWWLTCGERYFNDLKIHKKPFPHNFCRFEQTRHKGYFNLLYLLWQIQWLAILQDLELERIYSRWGFDNLFRLLLRGPVATEALAHRHLDRSLPLIVQMYPWV